MRYRETDPLRILDNIYFDTGIEVDDALRRRGVRDIMEARSFPRLGGLAPRVAKRSGKGR